MQVVTEGPTRKNVFKEVARLRSADAEVLLEEKRQLGAVYLLGYSIECYLKFVACEKNDWIHLPRAVRMFPQCPPLALYTHDWSVLVEVSGIQASITVQLDIAVLYSTLCEQWGPHIRYRTSAFHGREGVTLYNELTQFYKFLKELIP